MKKAVALLLAVLILASFAACGSRKDSYVVGVCQLTQHPALDAATEGFTVALKEALGDKVEIVVKNASGDIPACATIANGFVSQKVDLILANATPALQACANATMDIPILGTSVTEYGVALGLKDFNGTVGGNISGTSDLAPLDEQAKMITDLFPNAKKVALLYCSAEPNSQYQVEVVKSELEKKDIEAKFFSFSEANELTATAVGACAYADVIYVPTDNTVANAANILYGVTKEYNVPVIAGEEGICKGCGVASLTISYYDLGYKTGQMAAQILKGEAKIGDMPIAYAPNFTKKYNPETCKDLGIEAPAGYEAVG